MNPLRDFLIFWCPMLFKSSERMEARLRRLDMRVKRLRVKIKHAEAEAIGVRAELNYLEAHRAQA